MSETRAHNWTVVRQGVECTITWAREKIFWFVAILSLIYIIQKIMHKHSVENMIYEYHDTYHFLHSRASLSERIADLCRYLFPVRIVVLDAWW